MDCDVLVPGLRVHRDHQVRAAAARRQVAGFGDPHLIPGRQALDVGREDVAGRRRDSHAQDRLGEQRVGAGRPRSVDVGELDDEVVDPLEGLPRGLFAAACVLRPLVPAWATSIRKRSISHAPVGQRSAHSPQCRQTSSSFAMMRPVFSWPDTYSACSRLCAGAVRRVRSSASSPSSVKVMQSTGQMSTQASHSMHSLSVNTVCTSQFRQRCASAKASLSSKPSSTSALMSFSAIALSRCGTLKRRSSETALS